MTALNFRTFCFMATASAVMAIAPPVLAEGVLVKAQPADNTELGEFDGKISLWFSGNVSERSPSLIVVDGTGTRVDRNDMRLRIGERSELTATTKPLPPGAYVIRYRVLTEDGLVVSGIRRFTIKA